MDACVAPANIGEYGLSLLANIECEGLTISRTDSRSLLA